MVVSLASFFIDGCLGGAPQQEPDWREKTNRFMDEHWMEVLGIPVLAGALLYAMTNDYLYQPDL